LSDYWIFHGREGLLYVVPYRLVWLVMVILFGSLQSSSFEWTHPNSATILKDFVAILAAPVHHLESTLFGGRILLPTRQIDRRRRAIAPRAATVHAFSIVDGATVGIGGRLLLWTEQ